MTTQTIDLGDLLNPNSDVEAQHDLQEWVVSGLHKPEEPQEEPTSVESDYAEAVAATQSQITRLQIAAHDLGLENLAVSLKEEIANEVLKATQIISNPTHTQLEHATAAGALMAFTHVDKLIDILNS